MVSKGLDTISTVRLDVLMTDTLKLWHSSIRLPEWFTAPTQRVQLAWSQHAGDECKADRYGEIRQLKSLTLKRFQVIEVGTYGRQVTKILFRGSLDDSRDLCIVLVPNGNRPWRVKTAWVNVKDDTHKTLDHSKYVR